MGDRSPIFFFHQNKEWGVFSQFYPAPFSAWVGGKQYKYHSAEQYMMHRKALEGTVQPDMKAAEEILKCPKPAGCKRLGREVRGFNTKRWGECKRRVVEDGSYLKFTSAEELKALLLETGERELVEASRFDRIWGVGFSAKQCKEGEKVGAGRAAWGENLLGKALMHARERIRKEDEDGELGRKELCCN